jgi:hypothetical protein
MSLDSSGRLGIGTTSPSYLLQVAGSGSGSQFAIGDSSPRLILDYKSPTSSTAAPTITSDGEGLYYYGKNGGAGSHHVFHSGTSNTERARLDASGRLLVGTSSGRAVGFSSLQAPVQVETTTAAAYTAVNNTNDANGCYVSIAKTRGTSAGAVTAVQNNDELGAIRISGSDGTGFVVGAQIIAAVDGTPGTNDLPTRLVFSTTADGASSPTERMRITSDAYVRLASGTGGIQFNGDTAATNALDDYEEGTFTPVIIGSTTTGTATYSSQNGKYTKVGNRVFWEIYIDWTGGTGTGNLRVSGLPFTISIALATYPAASIAYVYNVTTSAGHQLTALQASGDTYVYFYQIPSGGGVNVLLDYDASGTMSLSGNYNVA